MDIVKKIRDGNVDKKKLSDSDSVSPSDWQNHFANILGRKLKRMPVI